MNKFILLGAICVLGWFTVNGQSVKPGSERVPKLVVGITIEHMRADYIDRYWSTFQNGGFKRLITNGVVFSNARADIHNIKPATLISSVYTGTYPCENGIVANKWYKQLTGREISAVRDDYYLTLGSDSEEGNVSATQLKTFTLGDVLKQQSNFKSKVFSVGMNAESAALAAGHIADGAFWYDKTNGNFITSSYYMDEFPDWMVEFNQKQLADFYMEKEWDLVLPLGSYKASFKDDYILEEGFWNKWNTFPYDLKKISADQEFPYEILKATPWGNSLVKDFVVQLIDQEELGMDDYPDLLNITFSALDYANKWFNPSSIEMQESFLRINNEIASLLSYLDKIMGKGNYLVVLTSASTSGYPVKVLKDEFKFAAGDFSPQSAMALLRSYLNAMYGVGDWIEMYNEEQVYLNHSLIEKKDKHLDDMREKAASFLNQFSGVKAAVPANIIESGNLNNPRFRALENSYCVQRSGDVILLLEEGWYPKYRYHQSDYSTENRVPLMFYGLSVKPGEIDDVVEVIDIVPTLCKILKIGAPDDAKGRVIAPIFW